MKRLRKKRTQWKHRDEVEHGCTGAALHTLLSNNNHSAMHLDGAWYWEESLCFIERCVTQGEVIYNRT
jgi:hypothetical protein